MRKAVDMAKNCTVEPGRATAPKVGVVVVRDGQVLAEAYRGQTHPGAHAEFCALQGALNGQDLAGATVYTTLEPCSRRGPTKIPCAVRLVDARVSTVFIGIYDPNPKIYREGWRILRDGGVQLRDFPPELRSEIRADNSSFLDQFRLSREPSGRVQFDFTQNGGRYALTALGHSIVTRWTPRGHDAIYALDNDHNVATARYAQQFKEIDDPSALDFANYTKAVESGEIVVFRDGLGGYALVKVVTVKRWTVGTTGMRWSSSTRSGCREATRC